MVDLPILLEERDVVDRGLNAQDDVELVIQLDGDRSHLVFDAPSQPTLVETIPHFILVVAMQFASQKGRNISGLDRLNKRFYQMGKHRFDGRL